MLHTHCGRIRLPTIINFHSLVREIRIHKVNNKNWLRHVLRCFAYDLHCDTDVVYIEERVDYTVSEKHLCLL